MRAKSWTNLKHGRKFLLDSFFLASFFLVSAGVFEFSSSQEIEDQTPEVPLTRVIEVGGDYGHYSDDLGSTNSQFLRFSIAKPDVYTWRFVTGRAYRFKDEAFDIGVSYTRYLPDGISLSLGISTGTGEVISPEYRVDASIGMAFLEKDNLLASVGYTRSQSKAENRSDGVGLGLTYYMDDHWILSASGRYDIGQPGETVSTSGGLGITYGVYRKRYIGAAVEFGDVSYLLIGPSEVLVDYNSTTYKLYFSHYQTPSVGFHLRLDYERNSFYDLVGGSITLFKEW
ncbi:MAG: hypothetical protein AMJ92_10185 [candidate division Zixibacteria bacterium SM23_81]|nr:MAG: hypothetical protein AMJ92_10185 [candidate division Zixibacteria bacterium SM23_81]